MLSTQGVMEVEKINRILREVYAMICSNRIILDYPTVKQNTGHVNLHFFDADKTLQDNINLGDYLSKIVVNWMLKNKGLSLETCIGTKDKRNLYAIGSVLLMGYQNATVWGTGLPFEPSLLRGLFHTRLIRSLDVRAVRGPYTRKALTKLGHKCPGVYGDPVVLMPMIYAQTTTNKTNVNSLSIGLAIMVKISITRMRVSWNRTIRSHWRFTFSHELYNLAKPLYTLLNQAPKRLQ